MSDKKSFILYKDQKEVIDELTDEEAGKLFKAIYQYNDNKEVNLAAYLVLCACVKSVEKESKTARFKKEKSQSTI